MEKRIFLYYNELRESELKHFKINAMNSGLIINSFNDSRYLIDSAKNDNYLMYLIFLKNNIQKGLNIVRFLRENSRTNNVLIMVICDSFKEEEAIKYFEMGADEYFSVKTWNFLFCRINSLIRRYNNEYGVVANDFNFDLINRRVIYRNLSFSMRKKELEILYYFCIRFGNIVTREELRNRFWPNCSQFSRALDMNIVSIRKQINLLEGIKLETIKNVGYRLNNIICVK